MPADASLHEFVRRGVPSLFDFHTKYAGVKALLVGSAGRGLDPNGSRENRGLCAGVRPVVSSAAGGGTPSGGREREGAEFGRHRARHRRILLPLGEQRGARHRNRRLSLMRTTMPPTVSLPSTPAKFSRKTHGPGGPFREPARAQPSDPGQSHFRNRSGKRGITADTALRLGRYFSCPKTWIGCQARYDLEVERDAHGDQIERGRCSFRPSRRTIAGSSPANKRKNPAPWRAEDGADDRTRTDDLLFTKQLLYQLSYVGAHGRPTTILPDDGATCRGAERRGCLTRSATKAPGARPNRGADRRRRGRPCPPLRSAPAARRGASGAPG